MRGTCRDRGAVISAPLASMVTALEGNKMAKAGRGGPALATAAIGSFVAGTLATLALALFAPALASVALEFGPAEYFALALLDEVPPGEGNLDYAAYLTEISRLGGDVPLMLEHFDEDGHRLGLAHIKSVAKGLGL